MIAWLPTQVARIKAGIWAKLSISLLGLVALFLLLGAVGLGTLRSADQRTQSMVDLQRRVAAYQALQANLTALRLTIATAFIDRSPRSIGTARRRIGQMGYDFDRAEFVSAGGDDARRIEEVRADYARLIEAGRDVLDLIAEGKTAAARERQERITARLAGRIERITYALTDQAEADIVQKAAQGRWAYRVSQYALGATALGSVAVGLLVGFAVSRSLVIPLRRVSDRLREIASGRFEGFVTVPNRDEIGLLAQNINRTSEQLETLYQRLEQASRHKGEFLATMSHEIRTPMNAIVGMTDLLMDTPLTREQQDLLQTTRDSGQSLLTIVDDVLDFSKIEAGQLELEDSPFDLRDCVESALDMIVHGARAKDLDLAYRIEEGVPEAVSGDVVRLRQILINLLNNAVKFTEAGEVAITVSCDPGAVPGAPATFRFGVRDTGIGIPADRLDRLFVSFRQVDASTTRKYGGTGLGLTICKRLATLMGGDVGVDSVPGEGTTFSFSVSLGVRAGEPDAKRSPDGAELADLCLMIFCDGSSTNCAVVGDYGARWGMRPVIADTRARAAALMSGERRPDLTVVDIDHHPGEEREVAQLLTAEGAPPAVCLVRRSGDWPFLGGFAAVVQKPVKPAQLVDAFADALGRSRPDRTTRSRAGKVLDPGMARRCPLRILLADDHGTNRKLATMILGRLGYAADAVHNGREVIDAVARKPYDLVLMDIHMPEMDGIEATRALRAAHPGGWPRIVMTTANVMQSDWQDCADAGADDIVRKPIDTARLIAVMERVHASCEAEGRVPEAPPPDEGPQEAVMEEEAETPLDREALETLAEMIGGEPAMFAELVDSFLGEAPRLFSELSTAAREDPARLRVAAHTLRSSAGDFGARDLSDLLGALERIGAAGGGREAPDLADAALAEWHRVEPALQAERAARLAAGAPEADNPADAAPHRPAATQGGRS